ncbi:hypothetical protein NDU88_008193 [Pleurodeles waltl]|uniref:Uncharacterized protein n=1 Tax=Pleurodeles waltl TaxID=8319 RepID=A0AAV7N4A6_PLEWA|nr:hypothetical protein NDU88_008193 [Pleurodeles waltl]
MRVWSGRRVSDPCWARVLNVSGAAPLPTAAGCHCSKDHRAMTLCCRGGEKGIGLWLERGWECERPIGDGGGLRTPAWRSPRGHLETDSPTSWRSEGAALSSCGRPPGSLLTRSSCRRTGGPRLAPGGASGAVRTHCQN